MAKLLTSRFSFERLAMRRRNISSLKNSWVSCAQVSLFGSDSPSPYRSVLISNIDFVNSSIYNHIQSKIVTSIIIHVCIYKSIYIMILIDTQYLRCHKTKQTIWPSPCASARGCPYRHWGRWEAHACSWGARTACVTWISWEDPSSSIWPYRSKFKSSISTSSCVSYLASGDGISENLGFMKKCGKQDRIEIAISRASQFFNAFFGMTKIATSRQKTTFPPKRVCFPLAN